MTPEQWFEVLNERVFFFVQRMRLECVSRRVPEGGADRVHGRHREPCRGARGPHRAVPHQLRLRAAAKQGAPLSAVIPADRRVSASGSAYAVAAGHLILWS